MAKTGSERTKDWRAQLVAAGYKQKGLLLSPEALADLKTAKARLGISEAETVAKALSAFNARSNAPPKPAKKRK